MNSQTEGAAGLRRKYITLNSCISKNEVPEIKKYSLLGGKNKLNPKSKNYNKDMDCK